MAEMREFSLDQFKGGLVTNVSNDALGDEEFPILQNVDFDNRAALIRRIGYSDITPTVDSLVEKYPELTREQIEERFKEQAFVGFQQGYFRLTAKPYEVEGSANYDLVPTFTNGNQTYNEADELVEIETNTEITGYEAWKAFDGDELTYWKGSDLSLLEDGKAKIGIRLLSPNGRRLLSFRITNNDIARSISFKVFGLTRGVELNNFFSSETSEPDFEETFDSVNLLAEYQLEQFIEDQTKEFNLEDPYDNPRYNGYILEINYSTDDSYGFREFGLGLEQISDEDTYDFENHKEPAFDSQINQVSINAVNGGLFIADLRAGSETFEYEGNVLPQNDTPAWRRFSYNFADLEETGGIDAIDKIVGGERLQIVSPINEDGIAGSLFYDYPSQLTANFVVLDFDLKVLNTRESRFEGIEIGYGIEDQGDKVFISWDNIWFSVIDKRYPITARDKQFHNYRFEINFVANQVNVWYDGDQIVFNEQIGSGNYTPRITIDFGHLFQYRGRTYPENVASEWKNFKVAIKDNQNVESFESDQIYPFSPYHFTDQFQVAEVIEAKQLYDELFVATGSFLVSTRFVINDAGNLVVRCQNVQNYAFVPNTKEYIYGGENILLSDAPDTILDTQGTTTAFSVDLFRTDPIRGYVDTDIQIKAYVTTAVGKTVNDYQFKWEAKKSEDEEFKQIKSWYTGEGARIVNFNRDTATKWDIKCLMRDKNDTANEVERILTNYELTETDENTEPSTAQEINTCTKIDTYYGKLLVYKNNTATMFKSYGAKPNWFATSGVIPFNNIKQEPLTKIIPLRNSVLGFTANTAIGLRGKGDDVQYTGRPFEPFTEFITYDANIGCIAPQSVSITNDGKCVFLSNRGIHYIDTLAVDAGRAEVIKIDDAIDNIVLRDKEAAGVVFDNKYYLCYASKNLIIKWHYIYGGIFSVDRSPELQFSAMYAYDNNMYAISQKSKTMIQQSLPFREEVDSYVRTSNQGYYTDDGEIYQMLIETKSLTFGLSQALKRFMRFYIGFTSLIDEQVELYIDVFADDIRIVSTDTSYTTIVEEGGTRVAKWIDQIEPNAIGNTPAILGEWELGIDTLGVFEETFRYYDIKFTPEAHSAKIIIRNEQDAFIRINKYGLSYILGYIPRELRGRL